MRPHPAELDPTAEQRALVATFDAICRDYPGAPPDRVEQLLRTCFDRSSGVMVHQHRLVLAERDTRALLRMDERATAGFASRRAVGDADARPAAPREGAEMQAEPRPSTAKGLTWMP